MKPKYTDKAVSLLKDMISIPSFSGEEGQVADLAAGFLSSEGCCVMRKGNNLIVPCGKFSAGKQILMLNSHLDTVRPAASYTLDPFCPEVRDGKLYGLGSNDAGASVAGLIAAFLQFHEEELPFNLLLALSAEEENSGENGMRLALPFIREHFGNPDMAIVGEPTGMQAAVAERGLVVLDCETRGVSGHAARNEGTNALYLALDEIAKIRSFRFGKTSPRMGDIRMNVTMISAGVQHNVIPDVCRFVTDIRTTDAYTNEETVAILSEALQCSIRPRSTRLQASSLPAGHILEQAADICGMKGYESPTTSDMALMDFPSIKIGIGDSARSHTADEYVLLDEVEKGIAEYCKYLSALSTISKKYNTWQQNSGTKDSKPTTI